MKLVLVTGGAGYIGQHVCAQLVAEGFEPIVADLAAPVPADVMHLMQLCEVLRGRRPDAIIHLAAHSDVAESVVRAAKYVGENTAMSAAVGVLANSILGGVPVVMASSAAVYGEPNIDRVPEGAPLAPVNPYGISKVRSEAVIPGAMHLRLFNVAGGRGDMGAHLIPRAVTAIKAGAPVTIFGDGGCVRDFVHVEDVARAMVMALQALLAGERGRAVNICSGVGTSVRAAIETCLEVLGRRAQLHVRPARSGDPRTLIGDNTLARDVLGWSPRLNLRSMILSAAEDDQVLQSV